MERCKHCWSHFENFAFDALFKIRFPAIRAISNGRNFLKGQGWPKGIVHYHIVTNDLNERKAIIRVMHFDIKFVASLT